MAVKRNIKESRSIFARLLAQENVVVDFDPNEKTASFDIKNRKLVLPVLKDMETFHYDGFIAHEVGHALHTPDDKKYDEIYDTKVPFDFVNITEDARIEKLVQEKYQGLKKDFYDMYKDFSSPERDFFGIEGKNIDELPLIDRVNLFFKIGKFKPVTFSDQEKPLVKQVADARSFDDAVNAAIAIYEYMKQNNQNPPPPSGKPKSGNGGGQGKGKKSKSDGKEQGQESDEQAGFTQRNFEKNREKMTEGDSNKTINIGETLKDQEFDYNKQIDQSVMKRLVKTVPTVSNSFQKFLSHIDPTVNMMVTQFNMKKAARDYQKTLVSKTGKLDMSNISMFKVSSDIFASHETVFEEKNHGCIFFIDYSGSMSNCILDTVKQLIVTLQFCRKAQIPFEVYGFTSKSSYKDIPVPENNLTSTLKNETYIFKIIDSTLKLPQHKQAINNLFNMSGGASSAGSLVTMGGTPLYGAALTADMIVNRFKQVYKREKTIVFLLSDGEPSDNLSKNGKVADRTILRDHFTYKHYEVDTFHDVFRYVKERNNVTKMIGFYITRNHSKHTQDTVAVGVKKRPDYKKHEAEFNAKKFTCYDGGKAFDKFYVIDIRNFDINDRSQKALEKSMNKKNKNAEEIFKNLDNAVRGKMKPMVFMKTMIDEIS